jgi:hypothetical protein
MRKFRRHEVAFVAAMGSLLGTVIHQVATGLQIY